MLNVAKIDCSFLFFLFCTTSVNNILDIRTNQRTAILVGAIVMKLIQE